ncbi:hypothetical protein HH310_39990 [Actinoplanes sp. TBRC 11911]|uniref:hypothetical protein n=1 Tax=Actinoplanes sp. TBRC 11911 TaxID=2729386 RepID=UPI00145F181B|nr:hypothetical protein [Actinoplanes sp. TBRC 11911]NMO57341.1 hypothetical protein [Actinoplanes sp. TBRC 11911]
MISVRHAIPSRGFDLLAALVIGALGADYLTLVWLMVPTLPVPPAGIVGISVPVMIGLSLACPVARARFDRLGVSSRSVLGRHRRVLFAVAGATFAAYLILAVVGAAVKSEHDKQIGETAVLSLGALFLLTGLVSLAGAAKGKTRDQPPSWLR